MAKLGGLSPDFFWGGCFQIISMPRSYVSAILPSALTSVYVFCSGLAEVPNVALMGNMTPINTFPGALQVDQKVGRAYFTFVRQGF